jgi:hypothetical protein
VKASTLGGRNHPFDLTFGIHFLANVLLNGFIAVSLVLQVKYQDKGQLTRAARRFGRRRTRST